MNFWTVLNRASLSRLEELQVATNPRFAYYTSADTALKIIHNKEVWMRNATLMNDYQEIEYGIQPVIDIFGANSRFQGEVSQKLEEHHPGFLESFVRRMDGWLHDLRYHTYLTCISYHRDSEDEFGRLSMWRAYGGDRGVALILNAKPFVREDDLLKVYSLPVNYVSQKELRLHLAETVEWIDANVDALSKMRLDEVVHQLAESLELICLAAKHPGFKEELEWRVYYRPNFEPSDHVVTSIECVDGTPQRIMKIPFKKEADLELQSFLDKVIIGPSDAGWTIRDAFVSALEMSGFENAASSVVVSGIPLRN